MKLTSEQFQLTLSFIVDCLDNGEVDYLDSVFFFASDHSDLYSEIKETINELAKEFELSNNRIEQILNAAVSLNIPFKEVVPRLIPVSSLEELFEYHIEEEDIRIPEYVVINRARSSKMLLEQGEYITVNGIFFTNE